MNFEYTEEQQQLADSLRRYLANEYAFDRRKAIIASPEGVSDTAWAAFAELGLTAITLPESDGGFGGGAIDLMAPMEACGEALVVEPLIETIGLGARLVARAGSPAQRERLLRGVAEGSVRLAFASLEPGRRYQLDPQSTTARVQNGAWLLDGEKTVVIGAPSAHCLIVSARTAAGVSLFLVPAGTPGAIKKTEGGAVAKGACWSAGGVGGAARRGVRGVGTRGARAGRRAPPPVALATRSRRSPSAACAAIFSSTVATRRVVPPQLLDEALAVSRQLELDPAKVNPNGSGISLGHPVGATGAIITVKALYELERINGRYALVTMCIGGGQGIAAIFERLK
jgi:hypothetical protein